MKKCTHIVRECDEIVIQLRWNLVYKDAVQSNLREIRSANSDGRCVKDIRQVCGFPFEISMTKLRRAWASGVNYSFFYLAYWVVGSSASLSFPHLVSVRSLVSETSPGERWRTLANARPATDSARAS